MAILKPTDIYGRVTYVGVVLDRQVTLSSEPREELDLSFEGPVGECHSGMTRPSCSRVKLQYPRGTEIGNARQLSILSAEELAEAAADMGIDRIAPEWTGANIIIEGIPDFTKIPPSSRLIFESDASVVNDMENGPCKYVGQEIEKHHPGKGLSFPVHAREKRGICGWVERPGKVSVGMSVRLHVPPQRIWSHA
ncbi:MAG: MOSC domain-containing protein [Pikeienuella sp.]